MTEFLAMGGYASFVWSAFAVTAVVMAGLWLISGAGWRETARTLAALQSSRRRHGDDGSADA